MAVFPAVLRPPELELLEPLFWSEAALEDVDDAAAEVVLAAVATAVAAAPELTEVTTTVIGACDDSPGDVGV